MFRRLWRSARLPLVLTRAVATAPAEGPAGTTRMDVPDSDAKIQEMAKLYSQMTLKEISRLQRAIFKELGHSDGFYEQALLRGMGGGGGGAGPAVLAAPATASATAEAAPATAETPKPAQAKAAPKMEKSSYDVLLSSYPADKKIMLVKELRTAVPALSIKDAKDAIDKAPGVIARALGKDDADKLKKVMEGLGAKVDLQ